MHLVYFKHALKVLNVLKSSAVLNAQALFSLLNVYIVHQLEKSF